MSVSRTQSDQEALFLEVQPGINIHYRVYKAINTFRKPRGRKTGSTIQSQVRRTASSSKPATPSRFRDDLGLIRSSLGTGITDDDDTVEMDINNDAEVEQEIPDGLEEFAHSRSTRSPSNSPKETEEAPKDIIFVLLHSFLGCTASWDSIVNPLRQYGTVISFDRYAMP